MDTFTLYVALRADRPLDDDALATVSRLLRPEGEELRIWVDDQDAALFRVGVDAPSADLESALQQGHVLAAQARGLMPFAVRVLEVSAMTDEDVMVWRAEA